MNAAEFKQALAIAKDKSIDLGSVDDEHHLGFGTPGFRPVYTTLQAVAKTLRWQGKRFDGSWDATEIDAVGQCGRKNFIIAG